MLTRYVVASAQNYAEKHSIMDKLSTKLAYVQIAGEVLPEYCTLLQTLCK